MSESSKAACPPGSKEVVWLKRGTSPLAPWLAGHSWGSKTTRPARGTRHYPCAEPVVSEDKVESPDASHDLLCEIDPFAREALRWLIFALHDQQAGGQGTHDSFTSIHPYFRQVWERTGGAMAAHGCVRPCVEPAATSEPWVCPKHAGAPSLAFRKPWISHQDSQLLFLDAFRHDLQPPNVETKKSSRFPSPKHCL